MGMRKRETKGIVAGEKDHATKFSKADYGFPFVLTAHSIKPDTQ